MRNVQCSFARLLAVAALPLLGCASTAYVYRPAVGAAPETEYTVAQYRVPPEAPRGEVYVSSFGITSLAVAPNVEMPMLHVRLGIANTSGTAPWTADAREQRLAIIGRPSAGPTYANSDAGGPLVTIPQGQQRALDLYYALPAGERDARDLPSFDVSWTVHTADRVIAERTPFLRDLAPAGPAAPPPPFVAVGLGWGPGWWYDPLWPYPAAVVGFRPFVAHYAGPRYLIGGRPTWVAPGWRGHSMAHLHGRPPR